MKAGFMVQEIKQNLKSRIIHGVCPAMATPLEEDGYLVNVVAIPALVEFLLAAGVKGLFVGGTTGEGIMLEPDQRRLLHERTMAAVAGRVPVLLHVGHDTTRVSITLAEHAQALKADAIVAVTPGFYPLHDDALFAYYSAVSQAAPKTPLLAYDIPQMAVNGISPELIKRLTVEIPTFAGLKSSRPDAQVVRRLIDAAPADAVILAGNEAIALGLLAMGANGLISGLSTAVPEPFVALTSAFASGDIDGARKEQRLINQVLSMMPAGARIGAIKSLLAQRGVPVGPPVPPRPTPDMSWQVWPQIKEMLESHGHILLASSDLY